MNRKDFLSSIPMLSAIPFLSTRVERESNKIILLDPKPIEIPKNFNDKQTSRMDFKFQILWNDCVVGTSYTEWSMHHYPIYEEVGYSYTQIKHDFEARARFDYKEIMKNISTIQNAKW